MSRFVFDREDLKSMRRRGFTEGRIKQIRNEAEEYVEEAIGDEEDDQDE